MSMAGLIERIKINSATVGEYAADAWRDSMSPFFQVEQPQGDKALLKQTSIDIYALHHLVCIDHQFNQAEFIRDRKRISYFDNDCIGLCFWLDGKNEIDNAGAIISSPRQTIFLMDMGKPVQSRASASHCLSIAIPKPALAQFGVNINKLGGSHIVDGDPRHTVIATALLNSFKVLPETTEDHAEQLATNLLGLVAGMFEAPDSKNYETRQCVDAATQYAVAEFIQRHLANPKLSVNFIAKALPYSRSTLYRQFAGSGGIALYIREQRLKRCYKEITSPSLFSQKIALVAARWGFCNNSHFSRLFKDYFGLSPRDAREQAMQQIGLYAKHDSLSEVSQAVHWFSDM